MKKLMSYIRNNQYSKFLVLLLLADLVFLVFHVLYLSHVVADPLLSIEKEAGYSEIYQYIKEYWIFLLMLMIGFKEKRLIYFAWAALFLYFLVDDSWAFHEKVGNYLTNYVDFKPIFNLKPADLGELIASMVFGALLFGLLLLSYFFSNAEGKKISRHLVVMVIILAFFGVFFDMLHVAIHKGASLWGIIEDWGEMIIMSVMLWYVFSLVQKGIDR